MKSILMSIKPKWIAKILNGEKTVEVRKRFPVDYRGWVYIYCTKDKETLVINPYGGYSVVPNKYKNEYFNGKVVARFWCDNVEYYEDLAFWNEEHEKTTCLKPSEFFDYMFHIRANRSCRLIHISQLEIFDKPKELSKFRKTFNYKCNHDCINCDMSWKEPSDYRFHFECELTKAPQSWQFIESEE